MIKHFSLDNNSDCTAARARVIPVGVNSAKNTVSAKIPHPTPLLNCYGICYIATDV